MIEELKQRYNERKTALTGSNIQIGMNTKDQIGTNNQSNNRANSNFYGGAGRSSTQVIKEVRDKENK